MADKTIILSKDPSQLCQEIPLIEGDNNTYVIRFVAPRYSGGVDLANLTWGVNIKNATLEQGFVNLSSATSDDSAVYIDWNVGSFATVLHGSSFCTIEGRNNSSSAHPVWKSSIVTLRVGRSVSADDIIDGSDIDSITEIAENVAESIVNNSVRYDTSQSLNSTQKTTARTNIGAVSQAEVQQAVATETSAREAAVSAEATAREAADNDIKGDVDALSALMYGQTEIRTSWYKGVFEANGFTNSSNANYCHTEILRPGHYKITPKSGFYFEIFTYVNDSNGLKLVGMSGSEYEFTTDSSFVVSSRKNPTAAISDAERSNYSNNIVIVAVGGGFNLFDKVDEIQENVTESTNAVKGEAKAGILMDSLLFFYYTQRPSISKNADRSISVGIPANPRGIYIKEGKVVPISKSIIATDYTVPTSSYFIYDITDDKFLAMTYPQINNSEHDLILLFHNNNGYLYGQWERYMLEDSISEAIQECKNYTDNSVSESRLPSYYESYMTERIATIRSRISTAGNRGVSFAFISDIHYAPDGTNNMRNSPLLLQKISRETPVKLMICGGDLITVANGSQDKGLALIQEVITDFQTKTQMDTLWAIGNHEFNNPGNDQALISQQLTLAQICPFVTQNNHNFVTISNETGAYYADDSKDKVRFMFAACNSDSTVNTDSITWLIEQLPSTPIDYDIVLISHLGIYYNPSSASYTGPVEMFKPILQALQAYKAHRSFSYNGETYDFRAKSGTVLGGFFGHYHVDGSGSWYDISCTMITTDSLNQREGTLTRTPGTITEQAFDIVTIDRDHKTIYCTRIGAGEDRRVVYN